MSYARTARLTILLLPVLFLTGCFTKQGIVMPWTIEHRALASQLDSLSLQLGQLTTRLDQAERDRQASELELRAALSSEIAGTNERIGLLDAKLDDFGSRLGRIAQRGYPAPVRESVPGAPQTGTVNPVMLYDQAYGDYTRGKYEVARQGFTAFLKSFPTSDLADNAQYWLGESFYSQELYANALVEFQKVVNQYPESDKLTAAMYKVGRTLEALKERDKAIQQYQALIQKYPNSQEAKLAEESLRLLRQ